MRVPEDPVLCHFTGGGTGGVLLQNSHQERGSAQVARPLPWEPVLGRGWAGLGLWTDTLCLGVSGDL